MASEPEIPGILFQTRDDAGRLLKQPRMRLKMTVEDLVNYDKKDFIADIEVIEKYLSSVKNAVARDPEFVKKFVANSEFN